MKPRTFLLAALLVALVGATASAAAEPRWKQWPAGTSELDASIRVPATFKAIPPSVPASPERAMLLNGRFRSPDSSVEFAITAVYARRLERSVEARVIVLPLLRGERVTTRTPTQRRIKAPDGDSGDYIIYEEDITVEGAKNAYTRYFRVELSTSSLPGAASCLWEFKARDDRARRTHLAAYRQFKDSLNLGED